MKRLGIIQPGKIGDIIICLPIARYYFNKGYKIYWPVDKTIIKNFTEYCHYVEFIPIDFDCAIAKNICLNDYSCNHIIDISFTIPGSWNNYNTQYYTKNEHLINFDRLKYEIADVPLSEKWNLTFSRNIEKERQLFNKLNPDNEEYIIVQWQGSDGYRKVEIDIPNNIKIIEAGPVTDSIFDWMLLLEKAKAFVLIDSCFGNLVEQMKLPQRKVFLARRLNRPTHKLNWKTIEYYD